MANWIKNWFGNSRQRVIVEGWVCAWMPATSDVPQAWVLGPLLFVIKVNDLDVDFVSTINTFTDDCKIDVGVNGGG